MAKLAKLHGPIFSLRLGYQLVVVGSSPAVAAEILRKKDRFLSGRFVPKAIPRPSHELDRIALVWNPSCSDQWKSLRALSRTELFSAKAIESKAALREQKVSEMIEFLGIKQGQVVNVGEVVFATVFNSISNLLFSKDFISFEDEESVSGLKGLMWKLMELGSAPNLADFYPIFSGLDLQGLRKKMSKCLKEMFDIWEIFIKERRERHARNGVVKEDFLDVFISNGFDDEQINWLIHELFSAGTDTTTTTVEWAMAELLKNKEAMNKVCQELEREINKNSINESQVSQFPYLYACIKETFRLHPPAPFLGHQPLETCEVMNYTIPKDSQIIVNIWAVGRDPLAWEDPLLFKPERFLESSLDLKGHDFELLPFSSGRRMCPGLPMAIRFLPLILASLIHYFDWSLPGGEDPAMLDMNDKYGITLQKEKPLLLVPNTKL
ncbi:hypothetical protein JCGZ_11053 [Jatropha curcas]|uniref:Uncharacterized protein n=1 Tax=Jatropha curcas TaxID=180498 RepID=A0A067J8Q3_JATCU|nr:hypothetical protein JCGZ_00026 [Jatropha curcas]KDP34503.1 hypothetical protein JCGZ_11053 [Jatropha curcas]